MSKYVLKYVFSTLIVIEKHLSHAHDIVKQKVGMYWVILITIYSFGLRQKLGYTGIRKEHFASKQ